MTYKEARVYLDEVSKYGSVLGLDTIRGLLGELGDPQDSLKFIHIAGTNGKGSVLAFTSTILSEAGFRTGRYVSPTVLSYLEKIQIDGEWISEGEFTGYVEEVQRAVARMEAKGMASPTVFEMETAIAFLHFRRKQCDYVVLETGLGGKLDATNIVKNTAAAVFTSISRDHTEFLGDTLGEIAEDKAGIIKPGCVVVSAAQEEPVVRILRRRAKELGCKTVFADGNRVSAVSGDYNGTVFTYLPWGGMPIHIQLAGRYQLINAAVVCELMKILKIPEDAVRKGFANTRWAGRFTCVSKSPLFIVDGAHNEDAARRLKESVELYFHGKHMIFIMGVFRDKEYKKIAELMAPLAESIYTVELPNGSRTLPAKELKQAAEPYCNGKVRAIGDVGTAVRLAWEEACDKDGVVLAFGSLSYLGEVMPRAQGLEKSPDVRRKGPSARRKKKAPEG